MRKDVSSSQLISRACLASYTAHGLLFDQPRSPRLKGWLGFIAWSLFVICVMSGPVATSAESDLSRHAEVVVESQPQHIAQNSSAHPPIAHQ